MALVAELDLVRPLALGRAEHGAVGHDHGVLPVAAGLGPAAAHLGLKELRAAYSKSGHGAAKAYAKWKRFNTVAYVSETHGNRYVNNYANAKAKAYIKFEKVKRLPAGSVLAKDSFQVKAGGKLAYGPLFLMTKMGRGWSEASGDWKYAMIMPDGTVFGTTKGKGADKVKFCYQCHMAAADKDSLYFLPEKYRVRR